MEQTFTCFLSGLEAPLKKKSVEHYCPKSLVPQYIWDNSANKFYVHRELNWIKGARLPCEWEELKFDLCYKAMLHWRMKNDDREFVRKAIKNWEHYQLNPCQYCLLRCGR